MTRMNIRELRNTRQLKVWLRSGQTVELRDRNRVLGHIVPDTSPAAPEKWPDFDARARKIFGDRRLPGADLLIGERSRY